MPDLRLITFASPPVLRWLSNESPEAARVVWGDRVATRSR
jgi:hypothetical protein